VVERIEQERIWDALKGIMDPEIPVLSLVEMKVIRSLEIRGNRAKILLSPTFLGCPALEHMKEEIRQRLVSLGCEEVEIQLSLHPPWSTDLLDDEVKEKLRAFGIAPPPPNGESLVAVLELPVACPFCNSKQTHLESPFGATLCKQLYYCDTCRQSFERFKPL
jgi:ring-1,2-phenylacetyl-CoA epoxidase subunit PaaD